MLAPLAVAIGSAVALFLWSLDHATRLRFEHPWLLYLLPVAGIGIAWLSLRSGADAERGTNQVLDAIHAPDTRVPARMAPLILVTTLTTHLFGGSAGREGTAVQMGGSIAAAVNRAFRLQHGDFRVLLMAGMAAGFGAVFGTPLAGAIFAIEVVAVGRLELKAALPALFASVAADITTTAWGIEHTDYAIASVPGGPFSIVLLLKACLAGVVFGWASVLFVQLHHWLARAFQRLIRAPLLRPALGGLIVIGLVIIAGSRDYLGLGLSSPDAGGTTILSSFADDGATPFAWLWKTIFTTVTLASGFKGGEVTPLFFVGATLGSVLGDVLNAPVDLFAGLGLVAVFAGAANTPVASAVMGVELFGTGPGAYFAVVCATSYLVSRHSGIYAAQRVVRRKPGRRGKGAKV